MDLKGFQAALEEQRERSRVAQKGGGRPRTEAGAPAVIVPGGDAEWRELKPGRQTFVGYEATEADTDILAFRRRGDRIDLLLENNPFYVESGGQVSDTGMVEGAGWSLPIDAVAKLERGTVIGGEISDAFEPTAVAAVVDEPRRRNIERNHSATHLMHYVLRQVLGDHVRQQGSLVDAEHLRFDFSHHGPVDRDTMDRIEAEVNQLIWANHEIRTEEIHLLSANFVIRTEEMDLQDALALGAMAFFADKYGDRVRVVRMGPSIELCGGTHVRSTGQMGLFRNIGQGGVAAGVRRVEALTGPEAYAAINRIDAQLAGLAESLKARPEHLARKIDQLLEDRVKLEARIAEMLASGGGSPVSGEEQLEIGGVSVVVGDTSSEDRKEVGALADQFRESHKNAVLVLFSSTGRGAIHTAVTDDLIESGKRAGDLVKLIAEVSGGKGGGRPTFASAGAGEVSRLPEARAAVPQLVERWLGDGNAS